MRPSIYYEVHMRLTHSLLWTSTCPQHQTHIITPLKQYNDLQGLKLKFSYCNSFKTVLLRIYIINEY